MSDFPPKMAVAADVLICAKERGGGVYSVVLIKRRNEPFKGMWAIPGGFVELDERVEDAAIREIEEEAGVKVKPKDLYLLSVYSEPARDPRGRTISVTFFSIVEKSKTMVKSGSDAKEADWFSLDNPPPLAFDHSEALKDLRERLCFSLRGG
ncbi:MAG: hypothetical protein Kow0090_15160 [Myxococcota bacterium]